MKRYEEAARIFAEGLKSIAPFYRQLPGAFTALAQSLQKDYLQACQEADVEPDEDLLINIKNEEIDMSEKEATMLQVLCRLEHHPGNPWKEELKSLQARVRAGEEISNEATDLLGRNENVLRWSREEIQASLAEGCRKGFEPLPGGTGSPAASNRWVCPRSGCRESLPVIREGEDAPSCPAHRVPMIRKIR